MRSEAQRRSGFAFSVAAARMADYHFRAGLTRAGVLASMMVLMAAGGAAWWAWPIVAIAALGVWLGVWIGHHASTGTRSPDPLVRWAIRSAEERHGSHDNNVAGQIDTLSSIGLSLVGPFAMSAAAPAVRLAVFAGAGLFVSSAAAGAFLDPAFYNPDEQAPRWMERARAAAGPALTAVAALIAVVATWPTWAWPVLLAICALPLSVQLRVRETDRLMINGAEQVDYAKLVGRSEVVQAAHNALSMPLGLAVRQARNVDDPYLFDLIVLIRSGYQELTYMENSVHADMDWPQVLEQPIKSLCLPKGIEPDIRITVNALLDDDRKVARWILMDLVSNAITAEAEQVAVVLELGPNGRTLRIEVADDGHPFPAGTWQASSGGLARLRRHLVSRNGSLTLNVDAPLGKSVVATWRPATSSERRNAEVSR